MNKILKTIGIICIAVSMLILIANLIYGNENIAVVGFYVAAVGYVLISLSKVRETHKQRTEEVILNYTIIELIYSYREMGKYIMNQDIPELRDIEGRIENELNDIAIRVKHKEEWIDKMKGI